MITTQPTSALMKVSVDSVTTLQQDPAYCGSSVNKDYLFITLCNEKCTDLGFSQLFSITLSCLPLASHIMLWSIEKRYQTGKCSVSHWQKVYNHMCQKYEESSAKHCSM